MAGAMRKMGIYLGLVEDSLDEQVDGDYESDYGDYTDHSDQGEHVGYERRRDAEPVAAVARRESTVSTRSLRDGAGEGASTAGRMLSTERPSFVDHRRYSAAADFSQAEPQADAANSSLSRIITLHPRTYNEARVIGEHFRDGIPVIMNLTEMDDSDAKRLVDFAAGLTFGLRGSIDRVTNRVFLLSPQNVNVTAEDKARIAEGGFFNQS